MWRLLEGRHDALIKLSRAAFLIEFYWIFIIYIISSIFFYLDLNRAFSRLVNDFI